MRASAGLITCKKQGYEGRYPAVPTPKLSFVCESKRAWIRVTIALGHERTVLDDTDKEKSKYMRKSFGLYAP